MLLQTDSTIAIPAKKKHSMLPLLVVLFLISYGLLSMLVVEQGRTIQQQRTLIGQLFDDSVELSSMKMKDLQQKRLATQTPAKNQAKTPSSQAPSNQAPSNQAPLSQAPSSQAPAQDHAKTGRNANKIGKPALEKPPKAVETGDDRRTLLSL